MRINYTECMYNPNLFYDLANLFLPELGCGSVLVWIEKIITTVKGEDNAVMFCPRDCMIKVYGNWYDVIRSGEVAPDINKTLALLHSLPEEIVLFPNDEIEITADSFEQELSIDLGSKS